MESLNEIEVSFCKYYNADRNFFQGKIERR
nr:MAG TPA: hypothetical protein [Caudoviricetes sp.]